MLIASSRINDISLFPELRPEYLNLQDKEGNTALMLAIINQNLTFIDFLLEKTHDFTLLNNKIENVAFLLAKHIIEPDSIIKLYKSSIKRGTLENDFIFVINLENENIMYYLKSNYTKNKLLYNILFFHYLDNGVYKTFLDPNFIREAKNKLTEKDKITISEIEEYNKVKENTFNEGKEFKEVYDISKLGINPEETLIFSGHGSVLGKPFLIPKDFNIISYTRSDNVEFGFYTHILLGAVSNKSNTIPITFGTSPFHHYQGGNIIMNNTISFSNKIIINSEAINNNNIKRNPCLFMLSDEINKDLDNDYFLDEAFQNKEYIEKSVNYIYENYFKHSGQLKTLIGIVNYTEYIKDGIRQNLIGKVKITNIKEILQYFDELSNKKIKNLILLSCRKINKKMSPKI